MICIENDFVNGFKTAIRGMRNPMNSWDKSDSGYCGDFTHKYNDESIGCDHKCPWWNEDSYCGYSERHEIGFMIGPNDMKLARSLAASGPDHAKFRRMIVVYCDITAPLYWWKEFDTYKVGTVANSCSTMHKIADKEFTMDDFSHEHLIKSVPISNCLPSLKIVINDVDCMSSTMGFLKITCDILNYYRELYLQTKDKRYWWQMIQLLPSSYNQKRTIMLSYEVLANIYHARCSHKLDEWRNFCHWIETLPYADGLIFQREGKTDEDCNTCARINSCEYKPGREELTRYNCPNYSNKESL